MAEPKGSLRSSSRESSTHALGRQSSDRSFGIGDDSVSGRADVLTAAGGDGRQLASNRGSSKNLVQSQSRESSRIALGRQDEEEDEEAAAVVDRAHASFSAPGTFMSSNSRPRMISRDGSRHRITSPTSTLSDEDDDNPAARLSVVLLGLHSIHCCSMCACVR